MNHCFLPPSPADKPKKWAALKLDYAAKEGPELGKTFRLYINLLKTLAESRT